MQRRFPIIGIRHHAFKGRLDELYELARGRRVTLGIEHENVAETDAAICFLGDEHLGYVRTGCDREAALQMIEASGRRSIIGRVVEVDRQSRVVWVEAVADMQRGCVPVLHTGLLEAWTYDGPLLPERTEVVQLHSMIDTLEMLVEMREPWDDEMQRYLVSVTENGWQDISIEFRMQLERTLALLTDAAATPGYKDAAIRLQYMIDYMGSPETRRRQAEWVLGLVRGEEIRRIRQLLGSRATEEARLLPESLVALFVRDGEVLMGRLWYLRLQYTVLRGVFTLLVLNVLLREERHEIWPEQLPRAWIIEWARRRDNETKADVVHQLIADYELEQSNHALAEQLDGMMIAIASRPQTVTNHFAQGSVRFEAGSTMNGEVVTQ